MATLTLKKKPVVLSKTQKKKLAKTNKHKGAKKPQLRGFNA